MGKLSPIIRTHHPAKPKGKKIFSTNSIRKNCGIKHALSLWSRGFGDKNNFNTWLHSKLISLGGRMPKDFLDTKFGMSVVKDELGRIEHGVLA